LHKIEPISLTWKGWHVPEVPGSVLEIRRYTTLSAGWAELSLDQIDFTDPSLDWHRGKIKIEDEWYRLRIRRAAVRESASELKPIVATREAGALPMKKAEPDYRELARQTVVKHGGSVTIRARRGGRQAVIDDLLEHLAKTDFQPASKTIEKYVDIALKS
jgi:hypothetical protein